MVEQASGVELKPGHVVAGKYVVERTIGRGGMGQVVAARHAELGTMVAIKVIHPREADDGATARFRREALAIAKLKGEHTVRIYDVGQMESGAPYMIMEHLEGRDLASLLKERGPLPPGEAVRYILQACEALAEAHDAGITHRDLKPGNIFLANRTANRPPTVRLLDFGLAKGTGLRSGQGSLTHAGDVIGTAHYMAPEQARGGSVDARTDVWGLGACLYRLVTRKFPFTGAHSLQVIASVVRDEPTPPRLLQPAIPAPLDAVILRCLRKAPAERYADMRQLADALRMAVPDADLHGDYPSTPASGATLGPSIPTPTLSSRWVAAEPEPTARDALRVKPLWIALGLGVVALVVAVVAVAVVALRGGRKDDIATGPIAVSAPAPTDIPPSELTVGSSAPNPVVVIETHAAPLPASSATESARSVGVSTARPPPVATSAAPAQAPKKPARNSYDHL